MIITRNAESSSSCLTLTRMDLDCAPPNIYYKYNHCFVFATLYLYRWNPVQEKGGGKLKSLWYVVETIHRPSHYTTGLNVLAKIGRKWQVNFIDSGLEGAKTRFQRFSGAKVCYSNRNVRFKNFMHMEWSKEKFSKSIVGDKTRLRLQNKHQKIEFVFTQLARYNWMHGRVLKYPKTILEKLANK